MRSSVFGWLGVAALAWGCASSKTQSPPPQNPGYQQGYPQQYPNQGYPQQYPNQGYPNQGYPQGPPPGTAPPYTAAPQPPVPTPVVSSTDPVATVAVVGLRSVAQQIIAELVTTLPSGQQQRVNGIPLVVDDTPGEVNAFAMCRQGNAAMAITDGMLQVLAYLAQAQAHDDIMGTRSKVDEYVQWCAPRLVPNQPIAAPPAGFFPLSADPRVISRQRQIFEEEVAFVLGHELAHHYLGHLGCTASNSNPLGEIARIASDQVPLFNQPNEMASDFSGTQNVLDAGRARGSRGQYAWTENGGLLTMRFFAAFGKLSPADLLLAFERSHPASEVRVPVIQQAAAGWRSSGGNPWRLPGL